jgi:phage gpG-like protein
VAVSYSIKVDDAEVRQMLGTALDRTGDLTRPLSEFGLWMVRDGGRRLRARGSQGMTNRLGASLTFRALPDRMTVGSNEPHAAVQQLGIKNMRAKPPLKRLAIPALRHLKLRHIWPRDLPKGTLHQEGGALVGKDDRVWYYLVESVTIPARPYLVFAAEAWAFLGRRVVKHLGLSQ